MSSFPTPPAAQTSAEDRPAPVEHGPDDVLARARAGELRAWSQLYQQHFDRVFRRLCHLVGQAAAAEDLTQETFARAVVALPRFDGRAAFSTWLCGIANNVARNYIRDQDTRRRAELRLAELTTLRPAGETTDRAHLRKQRSEALYAALARLPDHLREAFVLREVEGLSMQEAATQLGISSNNMTVRVWRAREAIRRELGRLGWLRDAEEEPT
jgi:RNA polymerase sigma-70 factor (ECF subfamily)